MSESERLKSCTEGQFSPWKKWGTFVSERLWGTVREDYSADGDAWNYVTHDMARSKAYRWGEDGLAGLSDFYQSLVFSLAFWNEKDPILKERLFGLNPYEGNHGEDVKEYYYYLDATPTQSYMKYLYKYPQAEYPYQRLVDENQRRTASDREFELVDTGLFDKGRYFDIFVEYAKAQEEDICIRIEICNRSSEDSVIHVLPQLLFRNRWSWHDYSIELPEIRMEERGEGYQTLYADPAGLPATPFYSFDYRVNPMYLYGQDPSDIIFTNNETNNERIWNSSSRTPYVKDGFHRYVVNGETAAVNSEKKGTKAAFYYKKLKVKANGSVVLRLRFTQGPVMEPLKDVDAIVAQRKKEADDYYKAVQPKTLLDGDRAIQRQAIAGMLWGQQFYLYDLESWLRGDNPKTPPPASRLKMRNHHWPHLLANHIISMPDKWEYPWFAAWDLAFHAVTLALVDVQLAKNQIYLLMSHQYQHPNGQIPAYEWSFSDLNPPAQAWAVWRIYEREKAVGKGDLAFLKRTFVKLMQNFNWWVNKIDRVGNNFFEGGFLGLDNISVIDRSQPLPGGGTIEQSDGTGWMAFFALVMMRMALELSKEGDNFQDLATVYFEHFVYIASAMQETSPKLLEKGINMWDEEDGFFYDVISYPDKTQALLKVRSFVGIIPFFSIGFISDEELQKLPRFKNGVTVFMKHNKEYLKDCVTPIDRKGKKGYMLSIMNLQQMQRMLGCVFKESEFLSDYGLRSLSKVHEKQPFFFHGQRVGYEPGESLERIKGGNSNWRGPLWVPVNVLFIDALKCVGNAIGDDPFINYGNQTLSAKQGAALIAHKLIDLFRQKSDGSRPIHGDTTIYQTNPHWKDLILFFEHYHGDTGRGLGASHQTGWSGLIANLIDEYG